MNTVTPALAVGAALSATAALLHLMIIVGGAPWYRFFGAGERMARMAEHGHWWPALVTLAIAVVLLVWAAYAAGASGYAPALRGLPGLLPVLWLVTAVYLLRGLAVLPLWWFRPESVNAFAWWSSLVCTGFGLVHLAGLWHRGAGT